MRASATTAERVMGDSERMVSQQTEDALTRLPPGERVRLIGVLWDSLAIEGVDPLAPSPEELAEFHRRLEEHKKDPSSAIPWEELCGQLRRDVD